LPVGILVVIFPAVSSLLLAAPFFLLFEIWQLVISERYLGMVPRLAPFGTISAPLLSNFVEEIEVAANREALRCG
jgi:hypothetical protein